MGMPLHSNHRTKLYVHVQIQLPRLTPDINWVYKPSARLRSSSISSVNDASIIEVAVIPRCQRRGARKLVSMRYNAQTVLI